MNLHISVIGCATEGHKHPGPGAIGKCLAQEGFTSIHDAILLSYMQMLKKL